MIARVPNANALPLVLSSKLGLVAVAGTDLLSQDHDRETNPGRTLETDREDALNRAAVRELLHGLGANLGMAALPRTEAGFPGDADGAAGDAGASALPSSAAAFPDAAVRRSLASLDAVWMRDGEVVACFAIESGLAGWESIRRLADLAALHPKLKAPLYAVTLRGLMAGLIAELHRPALLASKKPLAETLRLLEWDKLKSEVDQLGDRARYLKPEFLEGISEPVLAPKAG